MGMTVRAAALSNFAEVARQLGLNPRRLLRDAGLDWSVLAEPDRRVPVEMIATLLESAARESGCESFGLRMAESRRLSDFGAVSLLIAHQPTLREALDTTVQYRHLLNEALSMQFEEVGDLFILREELVLDEALPTRQAYELAIGAMFRMFNALLGPRWRPCGVRFTHAAPRELVVHRRVFGCEVEFDSDFNGFVCWRADLDRANPAADPALANYARRFVDGLGDGEAASMSLEVRRAAHLLLPVGRASIAQIARGLGVNVRTLQRRLEAEGAGFSDLLNGVRRELSERYLANPAFSMTEIARLLGYGHLSSFTRWFLSEYGAPPTQWRGRRERAGPSRGDENVPQHQSLVQLRSAGDGSGDPGGIAAVRAQAQRLQRAVEGQ
jgi:AraC-like DNA-binding protein